jgi:hypothetical protein
MLRVGRTPGRQEPKPQWRMRPGAPRPAEQWQGLVRPFRVGTTDARTHAYALREKTNPSPHPLRGGAAARRGPLGAAYARKAEAARERERERERDASATLTRPIKDPPVAHKLSTALFPNENTRTTTLSVATRSLSRTPHQKRLPSITGTNPNESYVSPVPLYEHPINHHCIRPTPPLSRPSPAKTIVA